MTAEKSLDFNEITSEYYQAILRFCNFMLRNAADAQDAAQDTFLKAWREKEKLEDTAAIKSWLFMIARNSCLDRMRLAKRFKNFICGYDFCSNNPQISESALTLKKAIMGLQGQQREVFILRHVFEFNTAETAKILNISEGSIKSHLSRAVDKIQKVYDNGE